MRRRSRLAGRQPRRAGVEHENILRAEECQGHRVRAWRLPPPLLPPRRLRPLWRDPATVLGLAIVVIGAMAALAAPVLAPHDPTAVSLEQRLRAPDRDFPLGTDDVGRDELSRLLYGARTTLGAASVTLAWVIAMAFTVGTLSATTGAGWIPS